MLELQRILVNLLFISGLREPLDRGELGVKGRGAWRLSTSAEKLLKPYMVSGAGGEDGCGSTCASRFTSLNYTSILY